jgi:hypothetical protein
MVPTRHAYDARPAPRMLVYRAMITQEDNNCHLALRVWPACALLWYDFARGLCAPVLATARRFASAPPSASCRPRTQVSPVQEGCLPQGQKVRPEPASAKALWLLLATSQDIEPTARVELRGKLTSNRHVDAPSSWKHFLIMHMSIWRGALQL